MSLLSFRFRLQLTWEIWNKPHCKIFINDIRDTYLCYSCYVCVCFPWGRAGKFRGWWKRLFVVSLKVEHMKKWKRSKDIQYKYIFIIIALEKVNSCATTHEFLYIHNLLNIKFFLLPSKLTQKDKRLIESFKYKHALWREFNSFPLF